MNYSLRLFDDSGNYISFLGGGGGALEDPEHMETDSTLDVSNNDGMCSSMNDALTPSRVNNVVDPLLPLHVTPLIIQQAMLFL